MHNESIACDRRSGFTAIGPAVLVLILSLADAAAAQAPAPPPRPPAPLPPLPAFASASQPWISNWAGLVPLRLVLPDAVVRDKGWPMETARLQPMPTRPATDRPPLAWDLGSLPSRLYLTPAGPPSYAPPPDPARLVAPWREIGPDADRPTPATDPVLHSARGIALAGIPELKQKPAPFLRIGLPDPAEQAIPLRLKEPPPDKDGPAASFDLPPKPFLPVLPPPAKP
jgi:hypothetical protein